MPRWRGHGAAVRFRVRAPAAGDRRPEEAADQLADVPRALQDIVRRFTLA